MKSTYNLGCAKLKTLSADILCINFGFGWWLVWAAYSSQVPNKTQWHTKHHSLRHQDTKAGICDTLITASRRMAVDWLSFSLEAKCMDNFASMWNYIETAPLLDVLCQRMLMANKVLWKLMVWTEDKIHPALSCQDNRPWKRLVSDQLFCVKASLDWVR